jgi:hypothetical protein
MSAYFLHLSSHYTTFLELDKPLNILLHKDYSDIKTSSREIENFARIYVNDILKGIKSKQQDKNILDHYIENTVMSSINGKCSSYVYYTLDSDQNPVEIENVRIMKKNSLNRELVISTKTDYIIYDYDNILKNLAIYTNKNTGETVYMYWDYDIRRNSITPKLFFVMTDQDHFCNHVLTNDIFTDNKNYISTFPVLLDKINNKLCDLIVPMENSVKDRNKNTVPKKEEMRFSLEIEWINANRENVAHTIRNKQNLDWNVTGDASIYSHTPNISSSETGETYPNESNKMYFSKDKLQEIETVTKTIISLGGTTNQYCGFHVHIDGSLFTHKSQIIRLLVNIVNIQDFLTKLVNMRDGGFKYSRPLPEYFYNELKKAKSFEEIRHNWYNEKYVQEVLANRDNVCWSANPGNKYNASRYSIVNLHSYFLPKAEGREENSTIEFRFFNGTLDFETIKTYISMCLEITKNSLDLDKDILFNKNTNTWDKFFSCTKNILSCQELRLLNNLYQQYLNIKKICIKKNELGFFVPEEKNKELVSSTKHKHTILSEHKAELSRPQFSEDFDLMQQYCLYSQTNSVSHAPSSISSIRYFDFPNLDEMEETR